MKTYKKLEEAFEYIAKLIEELGLYEEQKEKAINALELISDFIVMNCKD